MTLKEKADLNPFPQNKSTLLPSLVVSVRVLQKKKDRTKIYTDTYKRVVNRNRPMWFGGRGAHDLPSRRRTRGVSGVMQSELEGLRMGADGVSPDISPKAQEPGTLMS